MLKSLLFALFAICVFFTQHAQAAEDRHACMARYTSAAQSAHHGAIAYGIEKRGFEECYKDQPATSGSGEAPVFYYVVILIELLCIIGLIAWLVGFNKQLDMAHTQNEEFHKEQKRLVAMLEVTRLRLKLGNARKIKHPRDKLIHSVY